MTADAIATGIQDSHIDQSDAITGPAGTDPTPLAGADTATADHTAMMAPTAGADATHATHAADALSAPGDGPVVDSTGHILGTLNDASGLVVDGAGHLVGTVTTSSTARRSQTRRATSSVSSTVRPGMWPTPPGTSSGCWTR